jgi:hypothetical protein
MLRCRRLFFLLSAFFLMSGIAVYVLFRNANMLLFEWFFKPAWLDDFYIPLDTKGNVALSFLIYNVPDGLWLLSGILFIRVIWWKNDKWREVYVISFCVIAIVFETVQLSEKVPGTFDMVDLVLLVSLAFVEGIMFRCFIKRSLL